jgi:hypothetical protein
MTPELRRNVIERANALRGRLNAAVGAGGLQPVAAAQEAHRLFQDAADEARVRWLYLEIGGYGTLADATPLHEVLRVSADDRLVAHVAAYRTQRGAELAPNPNRSPFAHFFVESLKDLAETRDRVRSSGTSSALELEFGPHAVRPGYPTHAEFPRDVFERVCSGFLAALYLQLASALR